MCRKKTGFGRKIFLSIPSLEWKFFFISSRLEGDESINTYTDELLRQFVKQSKERGEVEPLNEELNS